MKFLILAFAIIGCANCALLDSATQGPNPQDIATPEPEYIDIDEPPPAPAPAPAPVPVQSRSSFAVAPQPITQPQRFQAAAPSYAQPIAQPQRFQVAAPSYARTPSQNYLPPGSGAQFGGHVFNTQNGYQYRQVRRLVYRRRY